MSEQEEIDKCVAKLKEQAEEASRKIMAGSFIRPELFETLRLRVVLPIIRMAIVQARADAMYRAIEITKETPFQHIISNESRAVIQQLTDELQTELDVRNATGLSRSLQDM